MPRQDTIAAYIKLEIGDETVELKMVCDYMEGMPATWLEPADCPEIHIKSIERIVTDPKHPGLFKGTGDFMPDWVVRIVQDEFYTRGYVYDQVMDALLDADGH